MKYIAHRGVQNSLVKQNTLAAFKLAIASDKFVGFEFDVRVTKDNVFVVCHDPFIKTNLIKYKTYDELKKYNIPRLIDVLKLKTSKIFLVEIKDFSINIKKLLNLLNRFNNKNIYLMSFSKNFIHDVAKYKHYCKLGVLNYVLNSEDNYEDYDFICLFNGIMTKNLVNYFKKKNIEIFVYGIVEDISLIDKNLYYIINEKTI